MVIGPCSSLSDLDSSTISSLTRVRVLRRAFAVHFISSFSRSFPACGNSTNDRLPGVSHKFSGCTSLRHSGHAVDRRILLGDKVKLEFMAESFNLGNRDNPRVQITQDGFITNSDQFVQTSKFIGINYFPAQYGTPTSFLGAADAYVPRQAELRLKLIY